MSIGDDYNWPGFGEGEFLNIECDSTSGIISSVLNTFGIPNSISPDSSKLDGLDIKRMDATQVINMALLELLATTGNVYELAVDNSGVVVLIQIGYGSLNTTDLYYEIQSSSYKEECSGVLVRGGKPIPSWKPMNWKPIWGTSKYIADTTLMTTNCSLPDFDTHAVIVYNNPNLDSSYLDGLDKLYSEIDSNPFDRIIGFARYIKNPESATDDTKILPSNMATIPILVDGGPNPDMGELVDRPVLPEVGGIEEHEGCWAYVYKEPPPDGVGVVIDIPDELRYEDVRGIKKDKFIKVEEVMLLGIELDMVKISTKGGDSSAANDIPENGNTIAYIEINDFSKNIFRLSEGKHYVIHYDKSTAFGKIPKVIFSKDVSITNPKNFGKDTEYIVGMYGESGLAHAGETGKGTIYPLAENRGILVSEIWAVISIDSPSIKIYDPEYDPEAATSKASNIANELEYMVSPIIIYDPPAPISYNGSIVDQSDGVVDGDPTTAQPLKDTKLEQVLNSMAEGGGGVEVSLPFLNKPGDESKLNNLSSNLFKHLNHGDGVETTYVFGPKASEFELGQKSTNGVVNSINYSYNDSSSYTISVNTGGYILSNNLNSGGGAEGPYINNTESYRAQGTIIANYGNGMHFKVRIDGYGERMAINMSPNVLRVGDVVNCVIHNNPVEV
jgi:hypothetical protein